MFIIIFCVSVRLICVAETQSKLLERVPILAFSHFTVTSSVSIATASMASLFSSVVGIFAIPSRSQTSAGCCNSFSILEKGGAMLV